MLSGCWRNIRQGPGSSRAAGSVSPRAFAAKLGDLQRGCLGGLHDAECNMGSFLEAGALGGGGNGLVVTTAAT
jgi:hypothetical protein